jgi:hypothetical protein
VVTPETDYTGKVRLRNRKPLVDDAASLRQRRGMRMRESGGGRYRCLRAGDEPVITGEPPEEQAGDGLSRTGRIGTRDSR